MADPAADRANQLVAAYILRDFRDDACPDPCPHVAPGRHNWRSHDVEAHLANCPSARVAEHEMQEGDCGTGCAVTKLTATITCDHGQRYGHEWSDFGSMHRVLAEIIEEEQFREAAVAGEPPEMVHVASIVLPLQPAQTPTYSGILAHLEQEQK